ncbi:unnamed protein product [Ranitomeya imitator]|uniref:E3 ubiquitin-protein ligase makorin-2 n=1 Tax=Ranitomeya imitator TaxID=111125 RepID=A0ABN9MA42_9NEOB|nr:unnamed protein product [Ranitomeya imitator]
MVYYPQDVPAASVEAPPASSLTVEAPPVVTKTTPHKREKKSIVLRDRDLCGQTEEKSRVDPISNPQSCSDAQGADQVLKPHSYLEAICTGLEEVEMAAPYLDTPHQLCPYAAAGTCHFGETCVYIHGDMCEICNLQVLHPYDQEQRKSHEKLCMAAFEHEMEKAFAFQASQDKVCSICMEVVYEKPSPSERRFGILSNCCHTYCLSCIRQWRCAKQFENPVINVYWVEDQSKKDELIEAFKQGMGKKACRYFDQGRSTCPFGGKCLYLHAYPDGTRADPEKPRKQLGSEGTVRFFNAVRLWDFIEDRENRSVPSTDDEVAELGDLFMHLSGADQPDAASSS